MLKTQLVNKVENILGDNKYIICRYNGCFDLAAKRYNLLLIKVLQNVDSFLPEQAKNLKIISQNLGATPMLVGKQTSVEKLKRGIVYERWEVPVVSLETLEELIIYNIFPGLYRDRGGLYVNINREVLKAARKKKSFSQRELAEILGINKKVIYEHEKMQLRMTLSIAEKLEKALNKRLITDIDLFKTEKVEMHGKPKYKMEKAIGGVLEKIGFSTEFVRKAPFNIMAKEKELIISEADGGKKVQRKAKFLEKFAKVSKRPAVVFTEKEIKIDTDLPVLGTKELKELSTKELLKIAKKKKH